MYGHIATLAESVAEGVKSTGADVTILQVPETLTEEVLKKMGAPAKKDYPIVSADDLKGYDGIIWGIPTRYGRAVAQISNFFDTTGGLWAAQALSGKFTAVFSSTGTPHGGQETTTLTTVSFFAHHGLIFVPTGYPDAKLMDMSEINGGTPWGASAVAGPDSSRAVSDHEKYIAKLQGTKFAEIVGVHDKGKKAAAEPAPAVTEAKAEASATPKAVESHKKDASKASSTSSKENGTEKKPKKRFSLFGKH
jgi:NAD(P)H dehydrogenase (quinone)